MGLGEPWHALDMKERVRREAELAKAKEDLDKRAEELRAREATSNFVAAPPIFYSTSFLLSWTRYSLLTV